MSKTMLENHIDKIEHMSREELIEDFINNSAKLGASLESLREQIKPLSSDTQELKETK